MALVNMFPCLTPNYTAYSRVTNAILGTKLFLGCASRISGTNGTHGIFGKFGLGLLFAPWDTFRMQTQTGPFACRLPALVDHVIHILLVRTKEQVVRANTSTIVAGMTDKEATRNGAEVELVREPMRTTGSTVLSCVTACEKLPVPIVSALCSPQPTVTGGINMRPESLFEGHGRLEGHQKFLSGVVPPAVSAARGLSVPSIIASQSHKNNIWRDSV